MRGRAMESLTPTDRLAQTGRRWRLEAAFVRKARRMAKPMVGISTGVALFVLVSLPVIATAQESHTTSARCSCRVPPGH
jgi:hypothetical protein